MCKGRMVRMKDNGVTGDMMKRDGTKEVDMRWNKGGGSG